MSTKAKKTSKDKLAEKTGKKVVAKDFDLMNSAAGKPDVTGADEDVLNITPKEVFAEDEPETEASPPEAEIDSHDSSEPVPEIKPMAPKLPKVSQSEESSPQDAEPEPISQMETKTKSVFPTRLIVLAFFLLAIITAVVIGGVIVYKNAIVGRNNSNQPATESTPEPTTTPEPTPTPTPETQINRQDIKIEVLNGSGIKGLAGKVVSSLEKAGYQDIKSGNADNFDYTKTQASVATDDQAIADLVAADLKDTYPIATTTTDLKSSSFDVVITLGQDQESN